MNGEGPYVRLRSEMNFSNLLLAHLGSVLLPPCLQRDHGKDQQSMKHDIFNVPPKMYIVYWIPLYKRCTQFIHDHFIEWALQFY